MHKLVSIFALTILWAAPGVCSAQEEAFDLAALKEQAQSDPAAQVMLGEAYQNGQGTLQDFEKAAHWYKEAASQGNLDALVNLATLKAEGMGTARDYPAAFALYETAAQKGHLAATHILGSMIENSIGTDQPPSNAERWYQKAAEAGLAESQTNLGVLYHQGKLVDQNFELARQWYEAAAEQNVAKAFNNLGVLYTKGLGVEQDYNKAAINYRQAAELGFSPAMTNLGVLYENGFGVELDEEQATYWYRKATEKTRQSRQSADLPDDAAIKSYIDGDTFDLKTLKMAAGRGDPQSQYVLGNLYLNGWRVPQDYVKAYKWINLVAMNLQPANALRDELQSRMTQGQLQEAQSLSRDWLADKGL